MRLKRKWKRGLKGSFTIEVSYIMPLVIFLIWNILFLSFFLYDKCVLMQGSYCTALRTERFFGKETEKEEEAKEKYRQAVEQKIICGAISGKKEVTSKGITVESELNMQAPGGLFYLSDWQGQEKQTAEVYEPVAFIRKCRKGENLWNYIQAGRG